MANILRVYLQLQGDRLHPVSEKILSTARKLGQGFLTEGTVFVPALSGSGEEVLRSSGLNRVRVFEGDCFAGFLPEIQAEILENLEASEVLLFPATPEGRALSSMTAARLHTGVTADCTALSFTEEGLLLQTRPAFGGNRMAEIVTKTARPQIASLRFSMPVEGIPAETEIVRKTVQGQEMYPVSWLDRAEQDEKHGPVILAAGGGLREKEDLKRVSLLADSLGAELFCSRALVDRGWMPRSRQIGLSGQSVSAELLITLGISGSVQFLAGLDQITHLCAVDADPHTPLMERADTPIQCDLYALLDALEP